MGGRDPLELRFSGALHEAEKLLSGLGWETAQPATAQQLMQLLLPQASAPLLPPVAKLYNGRMPLLTMKRLVDGHYLVLRLWPSDFMVGGCQVLLGRITEQRERAVAGVVRIPHSAASPQARRQQSLVEPLLEGVFSCESVVP
jgi:hypothetical protein